ncbi:MAG: Asp-tRNA(Asn)/Glu-tRNA(Gln) amidotransferase GatCAB subunit A [Pseudomonadales bacterium]|nr:Asp-tRNA(Asn)/Glu-tRNA(Gln) amidotransferase GatCAB subunit A [Pseudomonadales bacterium]
MTELHYQSLSEVCRQIKSGALNSVDVTAHQLERINRLEPELKSFAMVLDDQPMKDAEALDAKRAEGQPLGPLHGVPIGIKDLLFTKGLVTASGTRVMADFVPDYDATVVTRLREAGAVIVGKTQLTEGAFGAHHPEIESPTNPYDKERWPGVSSSGSGVSVAAGLVFGALGSDTGGSIRFPSASCGLVGIKPTYGRVSRYGAFPLSATLDHIGPMTRTVADAARILGVIAGRDVNDPTSIDSSVPNYMANDGELRGTKIGIDRAYSTEGVRPEVVAGLDEAILLLKDLGAEIVDVTIPPDYHTLVEDWGITCGVDCLEAHAGMYPDKAHLYGPSLSRLLDLGMGVERERYDSLERTRGAFRTALNRLYEEVDLMISPCMNTLPPTVAEMESDRGFDDEGLTPFIVFTAPFDYSGHPTLTMPLSLDQSGLPRSFQFIGPHLGEDRLIQAGLAFERARGKTIHPPIA